MALCIDIKTTDGRDASISFARIERERNVVVLGAWVDGVPGDHVLTIGLDVLDMGNLWICLPGGAALEGAAARRVADLVRAGAAS